MGPDQDKGDRGAAARARLTLNAAIGQSENGLQRTTSRRFLVLLRSAITGLVADVSDSPEAGITPRDAQVRLGEIDVPQELTARVSDFLSQCDAARYGSLDGSLAKLHHDAQILLDDLLQCLKTKKLLS